ncbi:hypothetical protein LWI28_007512 [Acer negundo]|uniref:Uncharacterized protein n=1 Tax=Acer negundo TaxID=4023 RepID=A0AAD5IYZ6_ACENE|nr:hypothetical protein LWI28_007512 [Acer negundo]
MKEDRIGTRGPEGEQNRSSLILSWAGDKEVEVEDWLSRAAIGKLKEFDSIDQGLLKTDNNPIKLLKKDDFLGPPSRVFTCPIQEGKDMEKGDSSGSIEYSEQKTGKKDGHGKVLEQGINFCIDLREQKFDNSSHTTGGSVSSTDEIGSQDTVIAETQVVENGGH